MFRSLPSSVKNSMTPQTFVANVAHSLLLLLVVYTALVPTKRTVWDIRFIINHAQIHVLFMPCSLQCTAHVMTFDTHPWYKPMFIIRRLTQPWMLCFTHTGWIRYWFIAQKHHVTSDLQYDWLVTDHWPVSASDFNLFQSVAYKLADVSAWTGVWLPLMLVKSGNYWYKRAKAWYHYVCMWPVLHEISLYYHEL